MISAITKAAVALPPPPPASWGTPLPDMLDSFLAITNDFRKQHGSSPLEWDDRLLACSFYKSMNCSGYMYLAHDDPAPIPRSVSDRFAAYYPSNAAWGENIAYGLTSPQAAVDAFASEGPTGGHWQNLVNPSWRGCGFAAVQASNGLIFWTQDFGSLTPESGPPSPTPTPTPQPVTPAVGQTWKRNQTGKTGQIKAVSPAGITWQRNKNKPVVMAPQAFSRRFVYISG